MKQFIYMDVDQINSIIAQNEKGLIEAMTQEKDDENINHNSKKLDIGLDAEAGASIWKLAKAEAALHTKVQEDNSNTKQTTTREIIAKTLHDAAFDIAYKAISPIVVELGYDTADPGDNVEISRTFQFVDLDYLEGLFTKGGVVDYIKQSERERIELNVNEYAEKNLNRDQRRQKASDIKKMKSNQIGDMEKQYDKIHDVITALGKIVPYKHMLVSADGYLIPVEDTYFRVNPNSMGLMFGGEMKCVGMITNIIGEDSNPDDDKDIFATIQFAVNEVLRSILPTSKNNLYVVSPLAIYYENGM